jgi:hypothetical protein
MSATLKSCGYLAHSVDVTDHCLLTLVRRSCRIRCCTRPWTPPPPRRNALRCCCRAATRSPRPIRYRSLLLLSVSTLLAHSYLPRCLNLGDGQTGGSLPGAHAAHRRLASGPHGLPLRLRLGRTHSVSISCDGSHRLVWFAWVDTLLTAASSMRFDRTKCCWWCCWWCLSSAFCNLTVMYFYT